MRSNEYDEWERHPMVSPLFQEDWLHSDSKRRELNPRTGWLGLLRTKLRCPWEEGRWLGVEQENGVVLGSRAR